MAKVVKGGRRFAFAALVVVGDQKGRVGYGAGKAREVPEAIRKATERAKRAHDPRADEGRPHAAPRRGRAATAPASVILRTAAAGTGIIAGGPLRAVFETLGIGDVVAKSLGSRNPHNMVKATFDALTARRLAALGGQPARQEGGGTVRPAGARRRPVPVATTHRQRRRQPRCLRCA